MKANKGPFHSGGIQKRSIQGWCFKFLRPSIGWMNYRNSFTNPLARSFFIADLSTTWPASSWPLSLPDCSLALTPLDSGVITRPAHRESSEEPWLLSLFFSTFLKNDKNHLEKISFRFHGAQSTGTHSGSAWPRYEVHKTRSHKVSAECTPLAAEASMQNTFTLSIKEFYIQLRR